jgi:hypothetical protein
MTLTQPVQDAMDSANNECGLELTYLTRDEWHAIRAELHRLTEIAEGVEPLVIRLHDVTEAFQRSDEQAERLGNRLAAANALLRECHCYFEARGVDSRTVGEPLSLNEKIQSHLQGAGDEA